MSPATDRALYGVDDSWARPVLDGSRRAYGDCEDYALEKRARLIAQGWPPASLAIAVAVAPHIGLHAVLIVQTDRGDLVLDNLSSEPEPIASLDYVWISRQVGPDLSHWSAAYEAGGAGHRFLEAQESGAEMFQRLMRQRLEQRRTAPVLAAAPSAPLISDLAHSPTKVGAAPAPAPAPNFAESPLALCSEPWQQRWRRLRTCFGPDA